MARVLIVDDEPLLCAELQETLEFEGFDVTAANCVGNALECCMGANFDIVVTDLKMPKRGGLELVKELKTRNYPATIYVVSGHGAETNKDQAEALGVAECFPKPLDADALIDAINQSLSDKEN